MSRQINDDNELAAILAKEAGDILLNLQASGKFAGKELGNQGDRLANEYLISQLSKQRPNDAILSEEEKDNLDRLNSSRVWIIDPLDGTREYGENRDDWAVHVGLAIDNKAQIGAVSLPALGKVLSTGHKTNLAPANTPLKMLVSRTRPAEIATLVAKKLSAELLPMGSAGAKAMAIVRGEADIYVHSGGQFEWDNCAPVAVAQNYGLFVSRLDGTPLIYNQKDPYLPDLIICRSELENSIKAAIAAFA